MRFPCFFLPFQSLCLNVWIVWIVWFFTIIFFLLAGFFSCHLQQLKQIKQNQAESAKSNELWRNNGIAWENWALISIAWLIHHFRLVQLKLGRNQVLPLFDVYFVTFQFFFAVLMNGRALMKIKLLLTGWDGLWTLEWYFMVQDFKTFLIRLEFFITIEWFWRNRFFQSVFELLSIFRSFRQNNLQTTTNPHMLRPTIKQLPCTLRSATEFAGFGFGNDFEKLSFIDTFCSSFPFFYCVSQKIEEKSL